MRSLTLSVLGTVALMACAESTGPPDAGPPRSSPELHILRWKGTAAQRSFTATRSGPAVQPSMARAFSLSVTDGDPSLTVTADFWAVRGQERSVQIDYTVDGATGRVLDFVVPANALAQWPDGTPFAPGDSVLITVSVDPELLVVEFQPGGLVFDAVTPAELQLWYEGADDDLDADGMLDADDDLIEEELLGIWYRPTPSDPWVVIGADQSSEQEWFKLDLLHFSGYAVSW